MTLILIAYSDRTGSTAELAAELGGVLTAAGYTVHVRSINRAHPARYFDAVVVGSSASGPHWNSEAVAYLRNEAPDLAERPVFLFQDADSRRGSMIVPRSVQLLSFEIMTEPCEVFGPDTEPADRTVQVRALAKRIDAVLQARLERTLVPTNRDFRH